MRTTIESYRELQIAKVDHEDDSVDDLESETEVSWMNKEPPAEFNSSMLVASSPIEPIYSPCGSDLDDDQESEHVWRNR